MYDKEYVGEEASFGYCNTFNIQGIPEALEARHYVELHQPVMHCFSLLLLKGDSCAQLAQYAFIIPGCGVYELRIVQRTENGSISLSTIPVQYVPCF